MKNKILQLLKEQNEIYLLDLFKIMPEIKGEYAIYMPVQKGFNPNVLWADHVSKEFIEVFNQLFIHDQSIDVIPTSMMDILFYGKTIYAGIPFINKRRAKSKIKCWMPISLIKGENFSCP